MRIHSTVKIHDTALVDEGATIGANTIIWHWTHICSKCKIGNSCNLGQNVYIANKVFIGDNVKIQNNVSVFDNVTLEDNVFCGPSVVFTNVYNPRSAISRKAEYKETLVRKGATLGANCTVVCGVIIGKHSFVGAGAVVKSNVKPYALMVGVPAKQKGWMSEYGERIELPLKGNGTWTCKHTGDNYLLKGASLTKVSQVNIG